MHIPSFRKGESLSASKMNELAQAVKAIDAKVRSVTLTDVEGGEFERGAFGTVLKIHQISPGDSGDDSSWEASGEDHPFRVRTSIDESGNVSVTMKGGRWHGNGRGNYLGVSYLEVPVEELSSIPESVEPGEDLFFIPDCGTKGGVGLGDTFAICLYSKDPVGGRLKSYPRAYLKKISSLKDFRDELLESAYSAVAIVGVWKLESQDGSQYLKGVPGQMLFGDFYYHNNQVFSSGKFGWSRVEGIPYGFRVESGLIHVSPNNFICGSRVGKIGKIAPREGDSTGLSVRIPRLSLKTEVNESVSVLAKISSEGESTGETEVEVEVPYYSITHSTGSVPAGYTLSESEESATADAASEYVQEITTAKETIHATPNDGAAWTKTVITGVASTKSRPSISYSKRKYALKSSGTLSVVTGVSASLSGTTTVKAKLPFKTTKYVGSEESIPQSLKSAELVESESSEYPVEGSLRGGLFEVREGDDSDAAKLGIEACSESSPLGDFSDFWISVPATSFKLEKSDVSEGVIIAVRLSVEQGKARISWQRIRAAELTESVKTDDSGGASEGGDGDAAGEEPGDGDAAGEESESAEKILLGAGCTHQLVRLTIEQRFETENETQGGVVRTGAVFGVKAALDASIAENYTAVFPVGIIFFDKETAAPVVQPLCTGLIEYTPPLALILNGEDEDSENASEFDALESISDKAKIYADKELSAYEAFSASAYGLETADLGEVFDVLEGKKD